MQLARRVTWVGRAPVVLVLALVLVVATLSASYAAYAYKPTAGLKAHDKSNASITLTWTRQSGINRYAIQYSTSSKFTNPKYRVPSSVTSQAAAFAAVRDLQPGTKYYFRIRATYADGRNASDWSKSINVTTSTYAFSAPSKPSFSNVLSTRFDLKWGTVPNAGQYRVRYSTSSTFASNVAYAYFTDTKGTVTGLQPNRKYYVQVRALESKTDDEGNPYLLTAYSSTANVTTPSTYTASPPKDLEVVGISKDKVQLSWTPAAGANGYRVQTTYGTTKRYLNSYQIPANAGSFGSAGGKVTVTMSRFCDSNGTCSAYVPGKSYAFAVTAMSGATRISDYTGKVSGKATTYPLFAPRDLTVKDVTSGSITLTWLRSPGATSYRIQQKKGTTSGETRYLYNVCGSGSPIACSINGDVVTATLTAFRNNVTNTSSALGANATYHLKVVAQAPSSLAGTTPDAYPAFDDRASEYTAAFTKATTDRYDVAAPTLGTAQRESTAITLAWPRQSGVTAYVVERSKNAEFTTMDFTSCLETSYLSSDDAANNPPGAAVWKRRYHTLTQGTTYFFRIKAVTSCTTKATRSATSPAISARTTTGVGVLKGRVVLGTNGGSLGAAASTMTATAYAYQDGQTGSDQEVAGTARVQANGSYTITGVRPGRYRVQLSQIGGQNYTSPWVSGASAPSQWADESHKFQSKSGVYTLSSSGTVTLPDAPVGVGRTLSGAVRTVSGGVAVKDVTVTAVGAAVAPTDPAREVRDVTTTLASGAYAFTGLFPGKYKITVVKSGSLRSSSFWVSPVESHPTINVGVCGSSEASCVPTPASNQYNGSPGT